MPAAGYLNFPVGPSIPLAPDSCQATVMPKARPSLAQPNPGPELHRDGGLFRGERQLARWTRGS